MTVVVCTDERGGMLFMGRRVSRDKVIMADVAALGGRLVCHPFSEKYLRTLPYPFTVSDTLLEDGGTEDVCFIESLPLRAHLSRIDRLIRYSFGERYPYDTALDVDPVAEGFRLTDRTELVGHSHTCITKEVYQK